MQNSLIQIYMKFICNRAKKDKFSEEIDISLKNLNI